MEVNVLLVAFIVVTVIDSLVAFAIYRSLASKRCAFTPVDSRPIETTTDEQQVRGESSFVTLKGRQFGITRPGFFSLVFLGYLALAATFAIAYIVLSRLPTT